MSKHFKRLRIDTHQVGCSPLTWCTCSRHWQLIQENGHVSRETLCGDLGLGEGTIKTLLRHLRMQNLIESTNAGTKMTKKGNSFFSELLSSIPSETSLSKCAITLGKFNYAVLCKTNEFHDQRRNSAKRRSN